MKNKQFIDIREYKINSITQYKVIIPTYKKVLGLFSLGIAVIPNGLGFICYPISYLLLSNSNFKDMKFQYSNKLNNIIHKIKFSLYFNNGKRN